jgi:hypothetical protein
MIDSSSGVTCQARHLFASIWGPGLESHSFLPTKVATPLPSHSGVMFQGSFLEVQPTGLPSQ